MSKLAKRFLTFFIGSPILVTIFLLPYFNHLPLNILVIIVSAIGANEFYSMSIKKTNVIPRFLLIFLTALLPICSYLFLLFNIPSESLSWIFAIIVAIIMGFECFTATEFSKSLEKISVSSLCVFYCGFMLTFISRITALENSIYFIGLYVLLVVFCDSAAWFFGMLFGKNNRGIFKSSPNKSIAGFLGGIFADVAITILAKFMFPDIFVGELWKIILLGFLTSIFAIIGDLVESVFKRSCDVKDSGNIIPGRGGILDCSDSFIVSVPIFYILIYFLYNL